MAYADIIASNPFKETQGELVRASTQKDFSALNKVTAQITELVRSGRSGLIYDLSYAVTALMTSLHIHPAHAETVAAAHAVLAIGARLGSQAEKEHVMGILEVAPLLLGTSGGVQLLEVIADSAPYKELRRDARRMLNTLNNPVLG